jgi:hypothetical protein
MVGTHQAVLRSNEEVDGSRLANTVTSNLQQRHATKIGIQIALRALVATINIITLIKKEERK